MSNRLSRAIWCRAYALEQSRQDHAAAGRLWRQAACCVGLAVFRLLGGLI